MLAERRSWLGRCNDFDVRIASKPTITSPAPDSAKDAKSISIPFLSLLASLGGENEAFQASGPGSFGSEISPVNPHQKDSESRKEEEGDSAVSSSSPNLLTVGVVYQEPTVTQAIALSGKPLSASSSRCETGSGPFRLSGPQDSLAVPAYPAEQSTIMRSLADCSAASPSGQNTRFDPSAIQGPASEPLAFQHGANEAGSIAIQSNSETTEAIPVDSGNAQPVASKSAQGPDVSQVQTERPDPEELSAPDRLRFAGIALGIRNTAVAASAVVEGSRTADDLQMQPGLKVPQPTLGDNSSAIGQNSDAKLTTLSVGSAQSFVAERMLPVKDLALQGSLRMFGAKSLDTAHSVNEDAQTTKAGHESGDTRPVEAAPRVSVATVSSNQHAQADSQVPSSPGPQCPSLVPAVPSATPTCGSSEKSPEPAAGPSAEATPQAAHSILHQFQAEGSDWTTGINTAHVVQTMNQSEMRVGMRSAEFGEISVRTAISQQLMTAQISVDHRELSGAISSHASALAAKLGTDFGMRASIEVTQSESVISADRDQSRQQQQQEQQFPDGSMGSAKWQPPKDDRLPLPITAEPSDSYRLDIRA